MDEDLETGVSHQALTEEASSLLDDLNAISLAKCENLDIAEPFHFFHGILNLVNDPHLRSKDLPNAACKLVEYLHEIYSIIVEKLLLFMPLGKMLRDRKDGTEQTKNELSEHHKEVLFPKLATTGKTAFASLKVLKHFLCSVLAIPQTRILVEELINKSWKVDVVMDGTIEGIDQHSFHKGTLISHASIPEGNFKEKVNITDAAAL